MLHQLVLDGIQRKCTNLFPPEEKKESLSEMALISDLLLDVCLLAIPSLLGNAIAEHRIAGAIKPQQISRRY